MHSQAPHSNCATACAIESVNVVAAAAGEGERARRGIYNYQMARSVSRQESSALSLELRNCS
jgi:hypothetical protein